MKCGFRVCLAAVCFLLAQPPSASPEGPDLPAERLRIANESYQQGDFAGAEAAYRSLLEEGFDSGTLYYNLGNACFKQRKLGEAIYFWEKAGRLLPRDRDIVENLVLANLMVVDRIEVPPAPLPVRMIEGAARYLTVRQESWIILWLFITANILMALSFLAATRRMFLWTRAGSLCALLLLLVVGASLGWKLYDGSYRRTAIVVGERAEIRSGPGTENVTVVTVHEGLKVQVRGETAGWLQVSLPNGWTGWLESHTVRVL